MDNVALNSRLKTLVVLIKSMCKAVNKLRNRRSIRRGPPVFCSVQCDSGQHNLQPNLRNGN